LDHQAEIDEYLKAGRQDFEAAAPLLSETNPALWNRLQRARTQAGASERSDPRP